MDGLWLYWKDASIWYLIGTSERLYLSVTAEIRTNKDHKSEHGRYIPNLQKNSEGVSKYTTYNGTCEICGGPGAPGVYESFPLSVWRSYDGIQKAQHYQTTGQTRKA